MKKFIILCLLSFIFLTFISCTENKKDVKKIRKIGIVQYTQTNLTTLDGFIDNLAAFGFVEGDNLKIINYGYALKIEDLNEKLKLVIAENPEIIFTSTTPAAIAAYKALKGKNIQLIFAPVNNPLDAGIVSNLTKPGEFVTGIRLSESDEKRLEWIVQLNPALKKILIPYNNEDTSPHATLNIAEKAAKKLNVEIIRYPVKTHEEITSLLNNFPDDIKAVYLPRDGMVMSRITDFVNAGYKHKFIISTPRYDQVQKGALTGYGFIGYEIGKQAGRIASMILKGTPAGDIPVETANDYFFLNLNTAEIIGLDISDSIIRQSYKKH